MKVIWVAWTDCNKFVVEGRRVLGNSEVANLKCRSDLGLLYGADTTLTIQLLANVHILCSLLSLHYASLSVFTHEWLTEKQKRKIVFCIFSVFLKIRSENFILSVTSLHFLSGHSRLFHLYQWMDCCFVEICRQQQRIHTGTVWLCLHPVSLPSLF